MLYAFFFSRELLLVHVFFLLVGLLLYTCHFRCDVFVLSIHFSSSELLHTTKCFECVHIKISFVFVSISFQKGNCCSWFICLQQTKTISREKNETWQRTGRFFGLGTYYTQIYTVIALVNISSKAFSFGQYVCILIFIIGSIFFHSFSALSIMHNVFHPHQKKKHIHQNGLEMNGKIFHFSNPLSLINIHKIIFSISFGRIF